MRKKVAFQAATCCLFLFSALVLSLPAQAQVLELSLHVNPNVSTQYYSIRSQFEPRPLFKQISSRYFPALGLDTEMRLKYALSSNFRIGTGIGTSLKRFSFGLYPYFPNGLPPQMEDKVGDVDIFYNFWFVEVPLLLQYDFTVKRKIKPYIWTGVAANFLLDDYRTTKLIWGEVTEAFYEEAKTIDYRNAYYRSFTPAIWMGLGLKHALGKRWQASIEPTFKMQLLTIDNLPSEYNYPDKRRFLSVGVNAGLTYQLSGKNDSQKENKYLLAEEEEVKSDTSRANRGVEVGINFSPTIRHVIHKHSESDIIPLLPGQNKVGEQPLTGWEGGITLKYPISKRFKIATGAFISRKGFTYGPLPVVDLSDGSSAGELDLHYHFTYLELPLLIQYMPIQKNKLKWYVLGGISANYLLNDFRTVDYLWVDSTKISKQQQEINSEILKRYDGQNYYYRKLNLGLWLGAGVAWQASRRFTLGAEPLFKMNLLNLNIFKSYYRLFNLPSRRYLYSVGLNLQVNYRIGK